MPNQLLKEWLDSVRWSHTGNLGVKIALVCPQCFGESERVDNRDYMGLSKADPLTIKHRTMPSKCTCLIGRTQAFLKGQPNA